MGQVYDPAKGRFDHHFPGAPRRPNGVPYSSIGLVWRQYGVAYLEKAGLRPAEAVERMAEVDRRLIQGFDAHDTGFSGPITPDLAQVRSRVKEPIAFISQANMTWLEQNQLPETEGAITLRYFRHAAEVAGQALASYALTLEPLRFKRTISRSRFFVGRTQAQANALKAAPKVVQEAYAASRDAEVLVLDRRMPWDGILTPLTAPRLKYVVFPESGRWRCQAVPTTPGGFVPQRPLPAAWRGLSEEDLRRKTGCKDAIFCHPAGFIMGAETKEGILALLTLARGMPAAVPEI